MGHKVRVEGVGSAREKVSVEGKDAEGQGECGRERGSCAVTFKRSFVILKRSSSGMNSWPSQLLAVE